MKIQELKYKLDDIITTDGYLSFSHQNNLCYIKTDYFYIGQFYWRGNLHPIKIDDICIIGHSDYPINDFIANRFKKVFCVNRDTESLNTFGLPLGITNFTNESDLHKIYGNKNIMAEVFYSEIKKENLAYLNFNVNTFIERRTVLEMFRSQNWVTFGDINNTLEGRKKYLQEIKSSKFIFCPRGNGVDTHRIWEALYMGSIPIVKYHKTHHLLTDLPILFIRDWSEITKEFLEGKYLEIIDTEWNLDKLKISYWENFILDKIRN